MRSSSTNIDWVARTPAGVRVPLTFLAFAAGAVILWLLLFEFSTISLVIQVAVLAAILVAFPVAFGLSLVAVGTRPEALVIRRRWFTQTVERTHVASVDISQRLGIRYLEIQMRSGRTKTMAVPTGVSSDALLDRLNRWLR